MNITDLDKGIAKYSQAVHFTGLDDLASRWTDVDPDYFWALVDHQFERRMPNFQNWYRPVEHDELMWRFTHNSNGVRTKDASTGYGIKYRKRKFSEIFEEDVRHFVETNDLSYTVLAKAFLKDEMRHKSKETRSIMCFQLALWITWVKHFQGLLDYFLSDQSSFVVSYAGTCPAYWLEKLHMFDFKAETHSIDVKKMDSRFNVMFVEWFTRYLIKNTNMPTELCGTWDWLMTNAFHEKQLIDRHGHVYTFPNGELSGFPGTIVFNTYYSLWLWCITEAIITIRHERPSEFYDPFPLLCLGDDVLVQHNHVEIYKEVVGTFNQEVLCHTGPFHESEFLSYKFQPCFGMIYPYYCNLDKMAASLKYAAGGNTDAYFAKMCSFIRLLAFAPEGSPEYARLRMLEEQAKLLMDSLVVSPAVRGCFYDHSTLLKQTYNNHISSVSLKMEEEGFEETYEMSLQSANVKKSQNAKLPGYKKHKVVHQMPNDARYKKSGRNATALVSSFAANNPINSVTREYLANTIVNTMPMRGPTIASVNTAVIHTTGQFTLPANSNGFGALMYCNDTQYPLAYWQEVPESVAFKSPTNYTFNPVGHTLYTLPAIFKGVYQGKEVTLRPKFYPFPAHYVSISGSTIANKICAVTGAFSSFTFRNNLVETDTYVAILKRSSDEAWSVVSEIPITSVADYTINTGSTVSAVYAIRIRSNQQSLNTVQLSDMTWNANRTSAWTPLKFIGGVDGTYQTDQYLATASDKRVVASDLLVSNFNPEFYKNGTLSVARVARGAFNSIPDDPDLLMSYIAASSTPHKEINMPLAHGCHVPWVAGSIDELKFQRVTDPAFSWDELILSENISGWVIAWRHQASDGNPEAAASTDQNMTLLLHMTTEAVSQEQILPRSAAPNVALLWGAWLNYLGQPTTKLISKNKGHMKKFRNVVAEFMKRESTKQALTQLGEAGISAARLLLPLAVAAV